MKKLVISSNNIKSRALKALANNLSERLGYRVYRVTPERVRNRNAIRFSDGVDKRIQLERYKLNNVNAPNYSLSSVECNALPSSTIVARQLTNSSEGKGIVIFKKGNTPPPAPLYTEYIPKKKEFRVHIWNNEAFHVTEKRKRKGVEERDTRVRNTDNGYVFCTSNLVEPDGLRDLAQRAVRALGRTYGAVDVIWNEKRDKCYVLEVNSRPGMEGSTVDHYAEAILKGMK